MLRFITSCLAAIMVFFSAVAASPIDGLLERIDPGASKKFSVQIKPSETDYFELDQKGKKVVVRANNYINAAVGINWYLKHHAGIHLSWNGMKAKLPEVLPPVQKPERHETDLKMRYDFNYCTFSYTMPFWDWERWEEEIDWMALHGINMPLAAVGQECVWRNMLPKLGYNLEEINDFISGPAFMAWWEMNNLEGWGGPNPESWYQRQEELQKQILKRMAEYGMKPVLPGYLGMVPHNADEKLGIDIIKVGKLWNGYQRPALMDPTDPKYKEMADLYYKTQEDLFGKADFYSMDPFHELTVTEKIDFDAAGNAIMDAMKKHNPKAIWVLQAWSENPRDELIENLNPGDLLILDLFSECRPMWGIPSMWQRENGFGKHDWAFCLLQNFGGNIGLHGRMDQLLENFYATKDHPLAKNLVAWGFTPEGIEVNPVMFELMSELPWRPEKFTKEEWLDDYVFARYGTRNDTVRQAWDILSKSIYNCPRGNNQQGPHESIYCCRPNLNNFQASSWSKMQNYYDPNDTRRAAALMVEAAPQFKGNNNFEYDLVDIVRQALADRGRQVYQHAIADYKAFDREGFKKNSQEFLRLLLLQDSLLASRPEFMVGSWIQKAKDAATTPEEEKLYEWNARVQITTWGNRKCADDGKLRDYAHKEWNGILRDFYYPRWEAFFASLEQEFDSRKIAAPIDFYALEEPWTLSQNPYPHTAQCDAIETACAIFEQAFPECKGCKNHK